MQPSEVVPANVSRPMKGFAAADVGGIRYVVMHYGAFPAKTPEWAAAERERSNQPLRDWGREMELREDTFEGTPVFDGYFDRVHCSWDRKPLPIVKGSLYFGGWDCGQTLFPAFVLFQVMPMPWQVHALMEVTSNGAESMEDFAPRVMKALSGLLPTMWDGVEHWADATVKTQNGANGESAQQTARRHGFRLRQSTNVWTSRYDAVSWLLSDMIDERTPRFVVDGGRCPMLREGFQGGYKIAKSNAGDESGGGQVFHDRPVKNIWSHVQDSCQYASMPVFKRLGRPKRDSESKTLDDGKMETSIARLIGRA